MLKRKAAITKSLVKSSNAACQLQSSALELIESERIGWKTYKESALLTIASAAEVIVPFQVHFTAPLKSTDNALIYNAL